MSSMPIGRFSKMARLSVKALRLYDRRGLLRPAVVDPVTRYRYYSDAQLRDAELIRAMRSLEMPLNEIAQLIAAEDVADRVAALEQHRTRLVEQMVAKQRMADYLGALIQHRDVSVGYQVDVVEQVPVAVASVRSETRLSGIGHAISEGFTTLAASLAGASVVPVGAPLVVYHDVIDEDAPGEVEMRIPVRAGINVPTGVAIRDLEGGLMAKTRHTGPYEMIGPAYPALSAFIAEHGYEPVGPPRETYLNDPNQVSQSELLTTVEFPVVQAGHV